MSMLDTTINANYVDAIKGLPDEAILGQLCFFSISQADVPIAVARAELARLGLPLDGLRKNLRPFDAFRKATAEMGHKFALVNKVRSELLVRHVGEDENQVYRQLILERVQMTQGKRRRVFYEKVGEITFTRGQKLPSGEYIGHLVEATDTSAMLGTALRPDEERWLKDCLAGLQDRYSHLLTHLDSHAVRSFVRETIYDKLGGTCVKGSGGLYFVKQEFADQVTGLGQWVRGVGSEFHNLPLLNLTEQRAMILQAFEEETLGEVDRIMAEVHDLLRDNQAIMPKTFDAYGERAAALAARVNDYAATMGGRAERAETQVQVLMNQILQLAGNVRTLKQRA